MLLQVFVAGCGVIKPVPVETIIQYEYRDSTIIKDSVRVVELPVERIIDIKPIYDTLELETSLAASKTWLDTTSHMLKGEMKNKPKAQISTPYKEKIIYRDSLVYKEVPVEVEVIKKIHYTYEKYMWIYIVLTLFAAGVWIYRKLFLPLS